MVKEYLERSVLILQCSFVNRCKRERMKSVSTHTGPVWNKKSELLHRTDNNFSVKGFTQESSRWVVRHEHSFPKGLFEPFYDV